MVLIQKGIEQIHKVIKRPSNTRCFLLSDVENNNRYTRMIKEIWEQICEDFPPTEERKTPDKAEDDNDQGKDEQECQKDTIKCVPSLTSSSEEKPAEHFQINDKETHLSEMEKWFLDILSILHCNMESEKIDIVQILDQRIQPLSSTLVIITKRLKMRLCKGRHQIWNKHLSEDQNDTLKKLTVLYSMYVLEPILISKPQKKGLARKMKIIKESLNVRVKEKELQKVEGAFDRSDKSDEWSDKNTLKILNEKCQLYEELFQWTSKSVKDTDITKFKPEEDISNHNNFANVIRSMEEVVATSKRAKNCDMFKASVMDDVSEFICGKKKASDMEPPQCISKYDPDTQRQLNKWFYKTRKILNDMEKESSEQKRKITECTEKIRQYEEHKEELLNRLSEVAGAKLKDNNPNITDLSDPNRPLKIAEQFSELYDKEWTSTLEHLTKQEKMDEEQAIISLLKTVKDCYSFCSEESENQVSSFLMCKESDLKKMNRMQSGELQHLHEIRKSLTDQSIPKIKKKYSNKIQAVEGTGDMESYVDKCIEISWYMVIQNPPVYMNFAFKKGDPLNKNLLKPYTKSGDTIDFLVWPVLYLCEDGSLLSKGVAQPTRKPRRRPVTAPEQRNTTTDEQESSSPVTPLPPQKDGKKKSKNEGS